MRYLEGGEPISENEACECFTIGAMSKGYWMDDIAPIWQSRHESEEARDMIFELSDYCLEIVCE